MRLGHTVVPCAFPSSVLNDGAAGQWYGIYAVRDDPVLDLPISFEASVTEGLFRSERILGGHVGPANQRFPNFISKRMRIRSKALGCIHSVP